MKSFHKMSSTELDELKYAIAKQAFLAGAKYSAQKENSTLVAVLKLLAEDYADQVRCNEIDLLQS